MKAFIDAMRGRWLALFVLLSGFSALAITIIINKTAGEMMGATETGRSILSAIAIAVDVIGICAIGLAAGVFVKRPGVVNKIVGTVAYVLMLGSVGFSVQSMVNFIAAERISVDEARRIKLDATKEDRLLNAELRKAREKAALELAARQQADRTRLAEAQLKWLQKQAKDASRGEKKDTFKSAGELVGGMGQGTAPTVVEAVPSPAEPYRATEDPTVNSEAGPALVAGYLGVEARSYSLIQMAQAAILLILYKAFAFGSFPHLWRQPHIIDITPMVVDVTPKEEVKAATLTAVLSQPQSAQAALPPPTPPKGGLAAPTTRQIAPPVFVNPFLGRPLKGSEETLRGIGYPVDGKMPGNLRPRLVDIREDANRFLQGLKAHGATSRKISNEEMEQLYAAWCVADNRTPNAARLVIAQLQRCRGVRYAKLRVSKDSEQRKNFYVVAPTRYQKSTASEVAKVVALPLPARGDDLAASNLLEKQAIEARVRKALAQATHFTKRQDLRSAKKVTA